MSWGFVVAAGATLVSSLSSQKKEADRIARQSVAENEAIVKSNLQNSIRTGYRAGLLNLQKAQMKKAMAQQGFNTTVLAADALGKANANAAASGTIGASVDAVANDVQMKLGEAQAAQQDELELNLLNFNIELESLVKQGQDAIVSATKVDIPSQGDMLGNAIMAAGASFAGNYASRRMSLGLGRTSTGPSRVAQVNDMNRQFSQGMGFSIGS